MHTEKISNHSRFLSLLSESRGHYISIHTKSIQSARYVWMQNTDPLSATSPLSGKTTVYYMWKLRMDKKEFLHHDTLRTQSSRNELIAVSVFAAFIARGRGSISLNSRRMFISCSIFPRIVLKELRQSGLDNSRASWCQLTKIIGMADQSDSLLFCIVSYLYRKIKVKVQLIYRGMFQHGLATLVQGTGILGVSRRCVIMFEFGSLDEV